MRVLVATAALAAMLGGCATQTADAPAFDPAACYERSFNIYFEADSTQLSREARQIMDAMVRTVRGCYIESVRVYGAADARGGAVSSEEVSEVRAQVIGEYLATRVGWPRTRMTVAALGERGAVTEEGLNVPMRRRAEVVVVARPPQ